MFISRINSISIKMHHLLTKEFICHHRGKMSEPSLSESASHLTYLSHPPHSHPNQYTRYPSMDSGSYKSTRARRCRLSSETSSWVKWNLRQRPSPRIWLRKLLSLPGSPIVDSYITGIPSFLQGSGTWKNFFIFPSYWFSSYTWSPGLGFSLFCKKCVENMKKYSMWYLIGWYRRR